MVKLIFLPSCFVFHHSGFILLFVHHPQILWSKLYKERGELIGYSNNETCYVPMTTLLFYEFVFSTAQTFRENVRDTPYNQ